MQLNQRICVVGLGYIGLPSAALLANRGYQVLGVDVNADVVETINRGEIHIVEPDLDSFVHSAVNSGRLRASLEPQTADIFIIAVPTPFKKDHVPNVDYVLAAARAIASHLKAGDQVILESTSPVGTTEKVADTLRENGVNTDDLYIAHCPERVLPGHIMRELVENDRIIGGLNPAASEKVADFYRTFVTGEVLVTDARTAEMSKLTENSFRDVNVAFANELSILCNKFSINVWELIRLANRHPRVNILQPGTGVGGHCIAVDPWFIIHDAGDDAQIIRAGREVNTRKTLWVTGQIILQAESFKEKYCREPKIACMGLAFKPNIDDLRESPALVVYEKLVARGYHVMAVEPNLKVHPEITLTPYEVAATDADIIVYLVGHREFKTLNVNGAVLDYCGVTQQ